MKKLLPALICLASAFIARSQVILNEMITASGSNNQFVELYNSGTSDVPLKCYTLVSVGLTNSGAVNAFNVIVFPDNAVIPAKGFYTAGKSATILTKPMGYNWNATTQPTGASFKKYTVSGNTITGPTTGTGDFFIESNGNTKLAVFLFDGSTKDASNNISYINGLVSYGSLTSPAPNPPLPGVPSSFNFASRVAYDLGTTSCGSSNKINWAGIVNAEYSGAATGTNHGYFRAANGLCGSWQKQTTGFTPNATNPIGTANTSSGAITSTERIECTNTQVSFTITAYPDALFPISVELYYDNNNDGILDATEYQSTISNITSIPYTGTFNGLTIPSGKTVYLAYRTPLGCIGNIGKATTASNTITTTQRNVCGNKVDFEVTNISADLLSFGAPLTANVYADLAPVGTLDANDVLIGSKTIASAGATTYSVDIPTSPTDYSSTPMLLQFTSSNVCFTSPVIPVPGLTPVATSVTYSCNTFSVTVTPPNADAAKYSMPLTADIYLDKNSIGELGPNDKPITTLSFTSLVANTASTQSYTITDKSLQGKSILVVYSVPTVSSCITPAAQTAPYNPNASNGPIDAVGRFPTDDQTPSAPVSYKLHATTNPNAYPITVLVYEDVNGNNKVDNSDVALDAPFVINSAPADPENTIYTTTNSYPSQYNVIVRFLGTCITSDLLIAAGTLAPLPVHFKSFTAVRKDETKVALTWTTASEQNNRGFLVQRNTGSGWQDIAFVFSAAENGTSNQELSYSYTDVNPNKGVSQYRILQVDLDGSGHYSETRSVNGSAASGTLLLFPNPSSTGSVTLLFDAEGARNVVVSDASGRLVQQFKKVMGNSLVIQNLSNGFYTVRVQEVSTGVSTTEKFIITKR